MNRLSEVLNVPADEAAKRLLGCELVRTLDDGTVLRCRIVETEAYDEHDPASHSHKGKTTRNAVMFGPAGFMYVYFIYGMYYCCNIATGADGHGEAVLIRAVEPLEGEVAMQTNRGGITGKGIGNGPGKLCQALAINSSFNGHDLDQPPLQLIMKPQLSDDIVANSPRIGIKVGQEAAWRFYVKESPFVSR